MENLKELDTNKPQTIQEKIESMLKMRQLLDSIGETIKNARLRRQNEVVRNTTK